MKSCLFLFCILSFFITPAQDREEDSLIQKALDNGFLKTAHAQYRSYQKDSAQGKIPVQSVNAARIVFISYYDADTARAILQALKKGMRPEQLMKRYGLKLHDDWDYAYLLEPLFVKQYYNKICFASHMPLCREDLVFENRQHFSSPGQIKSNTFFYELDDSEIRIVYFLEPYQKHALPGFMNTAFHYYSTLTSNAAPLYQQLYRLPADTANADDQRISDAWDNFPGQPARPKEPANNKDSLAQQAYKIQKQAYDQAFGNWDKAREQAFNARLETDPALKKSFSHYSDFLKKYPVSVRSTAGRRVAARLNLPSRVSLRYVRHRSMMYYGVYDNFMKTAIETNDYSLFARSFFFLHLYKNERPLDSLKTSFYQSGQQMYLGALGAVLLKSPGLFQKQSGGSLGQLRDTEKLQVMKTIEAWLATKPQDELMLYFMSSVYVDLADDLRAPKDEIDYEENLKPYLKSNRNVYYWIFDEAPEN